MTFTSSAPKHIAVIDMGSNSFNLIIARKFGLSRPVIKRFNITVQLARYLTADNILLPEGIQRCCNALKSIQEFISYFGDNIEVRANATYTIRSTVNKEELLSAIAKVFPYKINILSGEQEAKNIFHGIALSNPITEKFLACDIGGGSTEIICSDNLEPKFLTSKNLGCVSFSQKYVQNGIISREIFTNAFNDACAIFEQEAIKQEVKPFLGLQQAVGSSGTIKNALLAIKHSFKDVEKQVTQLLTTPELDNPLYDKTLLEKIKDKLAIYRSKYPEPINYLTLDRLEYLIEMVLLHKSSAQLVYNGFDVAGREVIVGGLSILKALFTVFKFKKLTYSDSALREGILYGDLSSDIFKQIKVLTVNNLRRKFLLENKLFNDFYRQALTIVQKDKLLHESFNSYDIKNFCVFMLVGTAINDDNFERHSNYILNNTNLYGFSYNEITQINQFLELLINPNSSDNELISRLSLLMEVAYHFTFSCFHELIKSEAIKVEFCYFNGKINRLNFVANKDVIEQHLFLTDNFIRIRKILAKHGLDLAITTE